MRAALRLRHLAFGSVPVLLATLSGACAASIEEEPTATGEHAQTSKVDDLERLCRAASPPSLASCQPYWRGEYKKAGYATELRADRVLDFAWEAGGPFAHMTDDFTARWTKASFLPAGRYRFTTTSDDGVRLAIDGMIVVDEWTVHSATEHTAIVTLEAGVHQFAVDYFEKAGGATMKLAVAEESPEGFRGEYFANATLSGEPALVRHDRAVDFEWGLGSPAAELPADQFSVRWTRSYQGDGSEKRLVTTTDDGVRAYVDGKLVLDRWQVMGPTTFTTALDASPGEHTLVVEYFEALGGATAKVALEGGEAPCDGWAGQYFEGTSHAGAPLRRCDPSLDFDWTDVGPGVGALGAEQFSARWTRDVAIALRGPYRFTTRADDRATVWVDGALVVDQKSPGSATGEIVLEPGTHAVRVDYAQEQGGAHIKLSYERGDCFRPGNLIACTTPHVQDSGAFVEIYEQKPDGSLEKRGTKASIEKNGFLRFEGLPVDVCAYGNAGHPYVVRQFKQGALQREARVTVAAHSDATMPEAWGCPASNQ